MRTIFKVFSERNCAWRITALAALFLAAYFVLRQDTLIGGGFFFRDFAFFIFTAEVLKNGEHLYRDVLWQYGPIPIVPYAMLTSFTGNSPMTYLLMESVFLLVDIWLVCLLLKRLLPMRDTVLMMFAVIVPFFVRAAAGPLVYLPLEAMMLLLLALTWRDPTQRRAWRAVLAGAILGGMQQIKFGGAFVAGLALILVDLICLSCRGWNRAIFWRWLGSSCWVLAAFLAMESIRAMILFQTLPPQLAADVMWPSYMLEHYKNPATMAERYPGYEGLGILIGTQLPGIIWLALAAYGLYLLVRSEKGTASFSVSPAPVIFLFLYYALGLFLYFKHQWLMYFNLGILAVPACWALCQCRKTIRHALLLALVPAALSLPYKIFVQKSATEPVFMPNHQILWLNLEEKARITKIFSILDSLPSTRKRNLRSGQAAVMVFGAQEGGVHFFGKIPHAARVTWFLPEFTRPFEEQSTFDAVYNTKAIIVFAFASTVKGMTTDPRSWKVSEWSPFSRSRDEALAAMLEAPVKIDDRWVVFPVKQ